MKSVTKVLASRRTWSKCMRAIRASLRASRTPNSKTRITAATEATGPQFRRMNFCERYTRSDRADTGMKSR